MTTDPWLNPGVHWPRVEEYAPGKEMLVCAADDEEWPCPYERDLAREEPA
jgi:hypothetical protein